jgi:hypothetical protein
MSSSGRVPYTSPRVGSQTAREPGVCTSKENTPPGLGYRCARGTAWVVTRVNKVKKKDRGFEVPLGPSSVERTPSLSYSP